MLKRQKSSAKFKKDYIAFLAVFLFFLVVCSEFTLAIWLPMQMRSARAWAKDSARQRMIDTFDHTRGRYSHALRLKIDKDAENELLILKGTLDYNARFLRKDPDLSQEEVKQLFDDYVTFIRQSKVFIFEKNMKGSKYCRRKKIDPTATLQRLKSNLSLKNNK